MFLILDFCTLCKKTPRALEYNRILISNNPSLISWEMVFIGKLLGIILILFMIMILLISSTGEIEDHHHQEGSDMEDAEENYEICNKDL